MMKKWMLAGLILGLGQQLGAADVSLDDFGGMGWDADEVAAIRKHRSDATTPMTWGFTAAGRAAARKKVDDAAKTLAQKKSFVNQSKNLVIIEGLLFNAAYDRRRDSLRVDYAKLIHTDLDGKLTAVNKLFDTGAVDASGMEALSYMDSVDALGKSLRDGLAESEAGGDDYAERRAYGDRLLESGKTAIKEDNLHQNVVVVESLLRSLTGSSERSIGNYNNLVVKDLATKQNLLAKVAFKYDNSSVFSS